MEIRQKIHSEAQRAVFIATLSLEVKERGDTAQCSYTTGFHATTVEDKDYVKLSGTMTG